MDNPHTVSTILVEAPMVSLPISFHRAVLISFEKFPFRLIVDVFVVVGNFFLYAVHLTY